MSTDRCKMSICIQGNFEEYNLPSTLDPPSWYAALLVCHQWFVSILVMLVAA
jgi:hypothetical protein